MYRIRIVDRREAVAVEPLGSKPKFWFREGERRLLFKGEDRGTGEDWAEVVASELCKLLGLPHVVYELAEEFEGERFIRPGVVCENMAPPPASLILGNQLLFEADPDYTSQQRFKVRAYTVAAVAGVLQRLELPDELWIQSVPFKPKSALEVFVGYIMLDAWIANQDRHHENWAALRGQALRLAPTFDHGAGLARNVTDDERRERLTTKDSHRTIAVFAAKARSAFYSDSAPQRTLTTAATFREFAKLAGNGAQNWLNRLAMIELDAIQQILDEVPDKRMSNLTKTFTFELLKLNRRELIKDIAS